MQSSKLQSRAATIACSFCLVATLAHSPALAVFTEQGATMFYDSAGVLIPGGANYTARSASLADVDNDGDLDLLFQGASGAQRLFRNNVIGTGSLTYRNIPLPSGLGESWSAAWGDYNGDGKVDVFVGQTNSSGATGDVMRNDTTTVGGVTTIAFTNTSASTGLNDPGFHQNVGWIDINNDKRLDLLIGMEGPEKHAIYLQDVSGQFSNVGAAANFQQLAGTKGYGMAIGDTDGDGDLDVYISTCRGDNNIRNNFYKNMLKETGTLTFEDIADTNGTQLNYNTYGTEFLDLDNDGDLDLYVTGAEGTTGSGIPQRSKIFRNDGNNQFADLDTVLGRAVFDLIGTDPNGSRMVDYDNDGDLDLFFHDNLSAVSNARLLRNDSTTADPWRYTDVTATEGITNTGAGGYDGVWGDLDRDGDLDLINPNNSTLSGNPTPERVYISDAATNGNHWLYVDLKGPSWNTSGIGSSLFATLAGGTPQEVTLRREANTNPDTFNQSDVPVHFGLGAATEVDQLLIRWPDGTAQMLLNVNANQYLTVTYNPGDYTGDNVIDNGDFIAWRKGMGTTYSANDYAVWRSRFGMSAAGNGTAGTAAVAEPTTAMLLLIAMAAFAIRRQRVIPAQAGIHVLPI